MVTVAVAVIVALTAMLAATIPVTDTAVLVVAVTAEVTVTVAVEEGFTNVLSKVVAMNKGLLPNHNHKPGGNRR